MIPLDVANPAGLRQQAKAYNPNNILTCRTDGVKICCGVFAGRIGWPYSRGMSTTQDIVDGLVKKARHRVWVFSDLQQADVGEARACMTAAVEDYKGWGAECEQMWYLGDAVEGRKVSVVRELTAMQLELLVPLGMPLRYVMGNHDFDTFQYEPGKPVVTPFWDAVGTVPGWRTTGRRGDFYFVDTLGDFVVVFFSDHTAEDGSWICTHGKIHRDAAVYPHSAAAYRAVVGSMSAGGRRVITAGHCAFAGGNRPSALMSQMLPLPGEVAIHFYGHAHIGDEFWVKPNTFRKIAYVEHQKVPQIDVASLENRRADESRSCLFMILEDGGMAVGFRDHSKRRWAEVVVFGKER
jgi:hypothetical protein